MCLPQRISGENVQHIATLLGNLLCLNFGLVLGMTPPHMTLFQSPAETPLKLPVDAAAATWLMGYLLLGAALGALAFGVASYRKGPKAILQWSGICHLGTWMCIHFGSSIAHMYASRFFAGVGGGAALAVLPIFTYEIASQSKAAAKLTATIDFWRTLGILLGLVLSTLLNYHYVAIIGIATTLLFNLFFPHVRESPYYYMRKCDVVAMEKSLRWYRGIREAEDRDKLEFIREVDDFRREMQNLYPIVAASIPFNYKAKMALYCFVLIAGAQLTGVYVVLSYTLELFKDRNVIFIFGATHFIGSLLAYTIGLRVNRKLLLSITGLIAGLSLIVLACASIWPIASTNSMVTINIALFSLYILSVSVGLQPFTVIVAYELLPAKLRGYFTSVVYTISWILLFALIQYYHVLVPVIHLASYLILFAVACFAITLIALFGLPDMESKSAEEVQRDMGFELPETVPKMSTVSRGHIQEYIHI